MGTERSTKFHRAFSTSVQPYPKFLLQNSLKNVQNDSESHKTQKHTGKR